MNFAATELIERFYTLLWPMLRISALLIAAPVFSLSALSLRIRILLALTLTWLVYPLHDWPSIDPLSASGLLEIFNQLTIGLVMGLTLSLIGSWQLTTLVDYTRSIFQRIPGLFV